MTDDLIKFVILQKGGYILDKLDIYLDIRDGINTKLKNFKRNYIYVVMQICFMLTRAVCVEINTTNTNLGTFQWQ